MIYDYISNWLVLEKNIGLSRRKCDSLFYFNCVKSNIISPYKKLIYNIIIFSGRSRRGFGIDAGNGKEDFLCTFGLTRTRIRTRVASHSFAGSRRRPSVQVSTQYQSWHFIIKKRNCIFKM